MIKRLDYGQDMVYGEAVLSWSAIDSGWRGMGGKIITSRIEAIGYAKRMDRILSGKGKNERAV